MKSPQAEDKLVRTTVHVPERTIEALRDLAKKGKRPLTWEIRAALQDYVERQKAAA